jgi:hypothetical protein
VLDSEIARQYCSTDRLLELAARNASKYRSIIVRGSPLRSPHWYSLTNLVAVISARVEIDRSSARCSAVSGRSSARNS